MSDYDDASADDEMTLGEGLRPLGKALGETLRDRLDRLFEQQRSVRTADTPSLNAPSPISAPPLSPGSIFANSPLGKMPANNRFDTVPMADVVVRFDLLPLLKEFSALVGLRGAGDAVEPAAKALETDRERVRALHDELDQDWLALDLRGAAFVFNWVDDVKQGLLNRFRVLSEAPEVYVATDLALVLNVLGRARGTLLLARAPLVLERTFLVRSLATTDPRLVELARASAQTELIAMPETKKRS